MNQLLSRIYGKWKKLKASSSFHSALIYLACLVTAALFWYILALNDNMQDSFFVKININDVPNNVTFISDVPDKVYVTIRDKGTSLMRHGHLKNPSIDIDFRRYASGGVLRYRRGDMLAALRTTFGTTATVSSVSLDSLHLDYTTNKGKRVVVVLDGDVSAASGYVISGHPEPDPTSVLVYSNSDIIDTIRKVSTMRFERTGLSENTTIEVKLRDLENARLIPDHVKVNIPVQTLVHKEVAVSVEPVNVPSGESLLIFPSKVRVGFYVPMGAFNDDQTDIVVNVDYNDISRVKSDRIPLYLSHYPSALVNVSLVTDSVEYTIVK